MSRRLVGVSGSESRGYCVSYIKTNSPTTDADKRVAQGGALVGRLFRRHRLFRRRHDCLVHSSTARLKSDPFNPTTNRFNMLFSPRHPLNQLRYSRFELWLRSNALSGVMIQDADLHVAFDW